MKKIMLRIAGIAAVCLLLAACASQDPALKPAPLTNYVPTLYPKSLWSRDVGDGAGGYYLRLRPAVVNNTIFIDAYDGTLAAINASNGQTIWNTRDDYHFTTGLVADDGKLFIVTADAQLMAINQSNGQVIWSVPTSSQVLAMPQASDGVILVHAVNGTLTAYAAKDGRQLWQYKESVPDLILHAGSEPQVAGDHVLSGFANGKVAAVSLSNGEALWSHQLAQPQGSTVVERMVDVDASPLVVDGVVYAASFQGQLVALNLQNGSVIWQHKISDYANLAANQQYLYVADADGNVWSFDEQTGAVLWKQNKLARRGLTAPVIMSDGLVVADQQGYVHWLSLRDGHFLARSRDALGGVLAAPVVVGNHLYVYSQSGRLVAYSV